MSALAGNRELGYAVMAAAELFQARHWPYGGWSTPERIPDVEDITKMIHGLADSALELASDDPTRFGRASSGRFVVECSTYDYDPPEFEVLIHLSPTYRDLARLSERNQP